MGAGGTRAMAPFTRVVLAIDIGAQVVAAFQLLVLTRHTDDWFAWTIAVPTTAALLGAGYVSALPSTWLAMRAPTWPEARIVFPMGLVITTFTALATFLHLDLFHLDDGPATARVAAWAWLVIYIAVPVMLAVAFVREERAGGRAVRAVDVPLGPGTRAVLLAHVVPLTALGLGLTIAPGRVADLWPWPLTHLTARAVAAWLLTVAMGCGWALREGDWQRVRVAFPALVTYPVVALVGAARFSEPLDGGDASTWIYVTALVASIASLGCVAWSHERERVPRR